MLTLDPSVLEKILRPLAIYAFLLVALRIGGQRELGQSNVLQFVLLLSVANAVQNGIIGTDDSITGAFIGAVTLFVANGFVELMASRNVRFHALVIGRPVELINRGIVNRRALRRQRIGENELMDSVIAAGGHAFEDVERATLSAEGQLTVTLKSSGNLTRQVEALTRKVDELITRLDRP